MAKITRPVVKKITSDNRLIYDVGSIIGSSGAEKHFRELDRNGPKTGRWTIKTSVLKTTK